MQLTSVPLVSNCVSIIILNHTYVTCSRFINDNNIKQQLNDFILFTDCINIDE
jgi:hypothetical protein